MFGKKSDKEVRTTEREFARASVARSPRVERVDTANGGADVDPRAARGGENLRGDRSILGSSRGVRARCARDGDVDARVRCARFVCIDSRRARRERAVARARADGMTASTLRGRRLRPERGTGDWARERERGRRD